MDDAACLWYPQNYFFPDNRQGQRDALEVCDRCTVSIKCLIFAMKAEAVKDGSKRTGIFGNKTPKERENLQKILDQRIKEMEKANG